MTIQEAINKAIEGGIPESGLRISHTLQSVYP